MNVMIVGDENTRVAGVRNDSRSVAAGDLFVARRGEHVDGTEYARDACARGATAILVQDAPIEGLPVPQLVVSDVRAALAFAAAAVYGHPAFSLDIVGITGTNGKTTTSHLVRAAIDAAEGKPACGVIGTLGHAYRDFVRPAEHTTPEADELARVLAGMRERGATHAVMEVSSIALELGRTAAVRFRVAAFTNLTQDHLDFHTTMEAYGKAKERLFTEAGPGAAVVNVDDAFGRHLASVSRAPVIRASARADRTTNDADVFPTAIARDRQGLRASFRTPRGDVSLESRLVGQHNLENLALALGIVCALDLDVTHAAAGLASSTGVPGRLERCDEPTDDISVLVDYAHTPDALVRALQATREVAEKRLVCVFGCGGDRDATKRGPMGTAAARGADVVILTSDNPRTEDPTAIAAPAAAAVRTAGLADVTSDALATAARGLVVELDRAAAIALAIRAAQPGDAVLIAGKGHEDYQVLGTQKIPFDDRIHARSALVRRRG
jgi:UDP-N-acetylmuramoyl-L-alanyl-D-glutamate--2,6-diaminopimelate ligase